MALAGVLAVLWQRTGLVRSPLLLALVAWSAWLWLSLLWAEIGWVALRGALAMSLLPLAFLIARELPPARWRSLGRWLLLAAVAVAAWGLTQVATGGQPVAAFGQRNLAGAFVLPVTLWATGSWLAGGRWRVGLIALALWGFIGVVGSRGVWMAGLPLLALLLLLARELSRRRRVIAAAAVCACLLVSLLPAGGLLERSGGDIAVAGVTLPGTGGADARESSLAQRLIVWRAALRMLEQAPWYGIGAQHFYQRYPPFIVPADQSAGQYAHNDYLQLLIELGWPGLLLTLGIYLVALFQARSRLSASKEARPEIAALLVAVLAPALHALVSYDHYVVPILLLQGSLLGRLDRLTRPAGAPLLPLGRRWLIPGTAMALLLALLPAASELSRRQGEARLAAGDLEGAERALGRSARLFDTDGVEYARAITYIEALKALPPEDPRRGRLRQWATGSLEEARRINPWNADILLGQALLSLADPEPAGTDRAGQAAYALTRCLALDPRHFLCREWLARLLVREGRDREARRLLEEGTAWPFPNDPAIAPYMELLADLRERQGETESAWRLRGQLGRLRRHWKQESGAVSLSP